MELIHRTLLKKMNPKQGFLAPYIQFPWGYDASLIGKSVLIYKTEDGFHIALESKQFKPIDCLPLTSEKDQSDKFKPIKKENDAEGSAVMGIRTPVASVRGSHDWPDYTITAIAH